MCFVKCASVKQVRTYLTDVPLRQNRTCRAAATPLLSGRATYAGQVEAMAGNAFMAAISLRRE